MSQYLKTLFTEHLLKLNNFLTKYYKDFDSKKFGRIQDPFQTEAAPGFSLQEESLIELSCDSSLKSKFTNSDLLDF